jgi:hypothetical protein
MLRESALAIPKHRVRGKVELPAIAAVAAISTTIAAAPATTTASAATAAGALRLGSCFVDYQIPAAEVLTV